ncbi:hypothetical protein ACVGVM_10260 [Pseudonocardia bannensis]|uniref:Uncharacterized protein n=2 Tax=Pseudonocardia bannensis TaxID=630973 RepID=A0A848DHK5_9PSEU|nr:hypothetical protein [Pseudonocardia bannensis]
MMDPRADRPVHPRRLRAVPAGPPDAVPDRRVDLAPPLSTVGAWADELMTLLRSEIDAAARAGVISTAESQQLLARLNLVVDQALTSR